MFSFIRTKIFLVAATTVYVGLVVLSPNSAEAQITINQPTISAFGVNTVVSVPDAGRIYMGGNRRLSMGRTTRGIPGLPSNPFTTNRASGYDASSGGIYATVNIINMQELEEDLMRGFTPSPTITSSSVKVEPPAAIRKKADFISRHLGGTKKH